MTSIDEQLEALRARKAAATEAVAKIDAERAQRAELEALRAEVEQAERDARDAPHIDEATATHGADRIAVVKSPLGAVVVKRPPHLIFRKFVDREKRTADDIWQLAKPCIVYPDHKRVDEMCEELPALIYTIGDALVTLAGFGATGVQGK